MIFLLMLGLALVLLLPLGLAWPSRAVLRERRETAVLIHRAQLEELARDLAEARIDSDGYAGARLEVERRLLRADALAEVQQDGNARGLLIATCVAIPVMAFLLYLPGSTPGVPSEPHAAWIMRQQAQHRQARILIGALRAKLAGLPAGSAEASEGEAYLAEALAEDAGQLTPEAIGLFRQSMNDAPAAAPWRQLDAQRLAEASGQ